MGYHEKKQQFANELAQWINDHPTTGTEDPIPATDWKSFKLRALTHYGYGNLAVMRVLTQFGFREQDDGSVTNA